MQWYQKVNVALCRIEMGSCSFIYIDGKNINKLLCVKSLCFMFLIFTDVLIAAPAIYLEYTKNCIQEKIQVSAQNCYKENKGGFTGETSPLMVKDLGLKWTFIGNAVRRNVFGETNEVREGSTTLMFLSFKLNAINTIRAAR